MPRGDRTGPSGMGPMTGRAAGYCAGYDRPGYANPMYGGYGRGGGFGRGFGGGGFGRGYRHGYYATGMPYWQRFGGWGAAPFAGAPMQYSPEQELEMRQKEVEMMEANLKAAKDYIAKLEKEKE